MKTRDTGIILPLSVLVPIGGTRRYQVRAHAAAAKFSRLVAEQMYGPHRPHGYIYGASGGAFQTIAAAENTIGVWDGTVPEVMGTPNSIPSNFTIEIYGLRASGRLLIRANGSASPADSGVVAAGR